MTEPTEVKTITERLQVWQFEQLVERIEKAEAARTAAVEQLHRLEKERYDGMSYIRGLVYDLAPRVTLLEGEMKQLKEWLGMDEPQAPSSAQVTSRDTWWNWLTKER